MKTANVTVFVTTSDGLFARKQGVMTTDLPDEAIGELVGETLRTIWANGIDPKKDGLTIVIRFD